MPGNSRKDQDILARAGEPPLATPRADGAGPRVIAVDTVVGRLAVEETGSGAPILLWHSLFCDRSMWRYQAAELSKDHRLLLVDGPGHGASVPPARPYTLDDCATAAIQVLDAFQIGRAILMGLSWGGMIFMRVALRAPERVGAMVLLGATADAETFGSKLRTSLLVPLFRRFGLLAPIQHELFRIMLGEKARREHPEYAKAMTRRLREWDREGLVRALRAVILERKAILHELPKIDCPTLVIVGWRDHATPPACAEHIVFAIPRARLERIPLAGHLSALESPAEVNLLIRNFLDKL